MKINLKIIIELLINPDLHESMWVGFKPILNLGVTVTCIHYLNTWQDVQNIKVVYAQIYTI